MKILSGYKLMWMIVMFDLPVLTKAQRKTANDFRLSLLDLGFLRCQLSVYGKFCTSTEQIHAVTGEVHKFLPPGGQVDILSITDRQYQKIVSFQSRKNIKNEKIPHQLELF